MSRAEILNVILLIAVRVFFYVQVQVHQISVYNLLSKLNSEIIRRLLRIKGFPDEWHTLA
jgi:hypothetical protein